MPEGSVNEDLLQGFLLERRPAHRLYEPRGTLVVLGAGGKPDRDLKLDVLASDGIPWRFRRGGGGAVVLSPGQVVLALVAEVAVPFANREYAREINGWFAEALGLLGVREVEHRGITDLAIGGRKILGTSIYRNRLALFYLASLLVSNDIALFGRYLGHPHAEPDYRRGREHAEFCTTLAAEGYRIEPGEVIDTLEPLVQARLPGLATVRF